MIILPAIKTNFLAILVCTMWVIQVDAIQAQAIDPLLSEGVIPERICGLAIEKVVANNMKNKPRVERKALGNFEMGSTYFLDYVLKRGGIVFGTSYNRYLDSVMDFVLQDYPELSDKVSIYILRSSDVNAYMLKDGVVLITMGLLSHLENEAQLAFVFAHEVAHWMREHGWNFYLEGFKVLVNAQKSNTFNYDDLLNERFRYSRTQEFEADSVGFARFYSHRSYDPAQAAQLMNLLKFAQHPYANIRFNPDFLFPGIFPESMDSLLSLPYERVIPEEKSADSLSTHPALADRITRINALAMGGDSLSENLSGEKFILSESSFMAMRNAMRRELGVLYLKSNLFDHAIYHSFLLALDDPDSEISQFTLSYALYHIAISGKPARSRVAKRAPKQTSLYTGEVQRVIVCHNHLKTEPVLGTTLALSHFSRLYLNSGRNPLYKPFVEDLTELLRLRTGVDLATLAASSNPNISADTTIQRILSDSLFRPLWSLLNDSTLSVFGITALPMSKSPNLCVLQPRFLYLVNGKEQLLTGERKQLAMTHDLQNTMNSLSIKGEVLDALLFETDDVAQFNRMRVASEWFYEYWSNNQEAGKKPEIPIRPVTDPAFRAMFGSEMQHSLMVPYSFSNWDITYRHLGLVTLLGGYIWIFPLTPYFVVKNYGGIYTSTITGYVMVDVENLDLKDHSSSTTPQRYRFDLVSQKFYHHMHQYKKNLSHEN